ncbi:MAG: nucleotide exchange factor GrpE [Caldilineaceae bacterium]
MTDVKSTAMPTEEATNTPSTDATEQTTTAAQTPGDAVQAAEATSDGAVSAEETPQPGDKEIIAQLRTELAEAQAKADEYLDKLQRTAAEFQNSRRRQEKQLADEIERASAHIIQRLLPIIDDLELAFQNVPAEVEAGGNAWLEGLRQIQKKLMQLLEDRGVTAIAKEGPFDPSRHEAVSSEPNETVESGHIIATLRTGYEYKDRVLRPALVRVAA